ncbi:hypothetical protein HII13_004191 [Brettanomyces bruxellensis]|nr:hypothetical protein HII13_004191 [Brettanomyces bruxellensis]
MRILTEEQKEVAAHLKASIWRTITKIVEEQTQKLSQGSDSPITATPQLVAALVELVYRQLTSVGEDLALFANHAGRKTITPNDMMMIVRKNPGLKAMLSQQLEGAKTRDGNGQGGKSTEREDKEEMNQLNSARVKQELISQSTTQQEDKGEEEEENEEDEEDTFSDMGDYI